MSLVCIVRIIYAICQNPVTKYCWLLLPLLLLLPPRKLVNMYQSLTAVVIWSILDDDVKLDHNEKLIDSNHL